MPGHNVLRLYHQMVGQDWHDFWPPPLPSTPAGVMPYVVFSPTLSGVTFFSAKFATTVDNQHSMTMQRTTDIGPLIPHVGVPNLYAPVILLLSGSKSHFGTTQYLVEGKPAAVAVAWVINLNLNCCGPLKRPPLPSGIVITHNTVVAAFTIGDFLAGVCSMVVDGLIEWGLNWAFFGIGRIGVVQRLTQRVYEKFAFRGLEMLMSRIPNGRFANWLFVKHHLSDSLFMGLGHQFLLTFSSVMFGSPVGAAPPWAPGGGGAGVGDAMDAAHDAARDYFNDAFADDHPSAPPPDAEPEPSGADAGAPDSGASAGQDGGTTGGDGTGGGGAGGGGGGTDGTPDAGVPDDGGTTGGADAGAGGDGAGGGYDGGGGQPGGTGGTDDTGTTDGPGGTDGGGTGGGGG